MSYSPQTQIIVENTKEIIFQVIKHYNIMTKNKQSR